MSRIKLAPVALCLCGETLLASTALAADTQAAVGAGSVLKALLALTLVLAAVFAAAWVARRFSPAPMGGAWLKVQGGIAVGTRERVMLVEIKDTWLVVGVAPGQVNLLHTLARPAEAGSTAGADSHKPNFAAWLRHTLERRPDA